MNIEYEGELVKMEKYRVIYNPFANNGRGKDEAMTLRDILTDADLHFYDITEIASYSDFFSKTDVNDKILVAGGDGTLNRFINDTLDLSIPNDIYYYAVGSGNDFWRDLGYEKGDPPVCINEYIKDLPEVIVNGKSIKVLNGVGYGIDGYCCEVGDKMRAESDKKINYTAIAVKGLLFHYHPTNAVVTVDGVKHKYKKVWLAPTMNGRYYGGGMMPVPDQNRLNNEGNISSMVMHGTGKLRTLMIFPSIFTGKHVEHKKAVDVLSGREITVEFERPTAMQIDGETILDVTKCTIISKKHAESETAEKILV